MIFSIDERLFELFPGLRIGVLVCRADNTRYGEDILEPALEQIRTRFGHERPQDHPYVRAWREAFAKLGVSASKYQSSIESLVRRALKGGVLPRVNPLVDLYNAVSLEFLVPIGGHDLSPLEGDIHLGFATGTEPFTPMEGGEEETAQKGEVIYRDNRSVLTRRWVWRQTSKDMVTPTTRSVFMPIDVLGGLAPDLAERVMERINTHLRENRTGEAIYHDILTAEKTTVDFTF
ncbi:MAG: phenylalanine--tRNA ligase beta subunit-related protein [Syntrophorhabdales bacterium]|jgi:DNA/RNA-binding domain of Phe-tRNA-synthetase-like protein